jgi:hypothetical protein
MEDGAPIHRSKAANQFRSSNFVESIPHPAQSPDLNPIEHVWKRLKVLVNGRAHRPRNPDELWVALQEEWEKIDVDFINSLVCSMPRHVEAVYKAKGGSTKKVLAYLYYNLWSPNKIHKSSVQMSQM